MKRKISIHLQFPLVKEKKKRKHIALVCMGIFVLGNSFQLFSNTSLEYQRAAQYLEERGEVCFTFYVESRSEVNKFVNMISVDKVTDGTEVFAYANKVEFDEFLKHGYYYTVETPPGLLTEVEMSDYSDYLHKNLPTEFDEYPTFEAYLGIMDKFAEDYPELYRVEQYGTSVNNRGLMVGIISDNVATEENEPKFFYQSTIHGDETAGYIMMLNLIEYLLSGYGRDARVTNLVENVEIWINPLANPDGTYQNNNSSVSGARRYNANNVDLNRDFPYVYLKKDEEKYTWRPRVETENQATMDLGDENTFTMSADFHGGAELVCYPWGMSGTNHADADWWDYVGREWAKLAQDASGSGYFTQNNGCTNCYDWYEVQGERINYAGHVQSCRDMTIEVSSNKLLSEGSLLTYWGYQQESILTYMEQVLYGIQGTITDTLTGDPIDDVMIFVKSHDVNNSHIYSNKFGGYSRPIYQGTYTLEITHDKYITKEITGVSVQNDKATVLDIELWDGSTGTHTMANGLMSSIKIERVKKGVRIVGPLTGLRSADIYSVNGTLVRNLTVGTRSILWDGKDHTGNRVGMGCYVLRMSSDKGTFTENFIYTP